MKVVRFEVASSTFVAFSGDPPADAEALEDWATARLADAAIFGLALGRRAEGRSPQWSIGVATRAELDDNLPRLEEAFAYPLVVPEGGLRVGDPLGAEDARVALDIPAGTYWVGLYPVSPEETFADFVLAILPADELAALRWPELPRLDAARRTPDDAETPVPLPPYDDDLPEGDAADFMASLFGSLGHKKAPAPAPGEPVSPFQQGLQALIDAELLELLDPAGLTKLADRLEDDARSDPFVMSHLGSWLVDQPEVDDVFGEDKELEAIVQPHVT